MYGFLWNFAIQPPSTRTKKSKPIAFSRKVATICSNNSNIQTYEAYRRAGWSHRKLNRDWGIRCEHKGRPDHVALAIVFFLLRRQVGWHQLTVKGWLGTNWLRHWNSSEDRFMPHTKCVVWICTVPAFCEIAVFWSDVVLRWQWNRSLNSRIRQHVDHKLHFEQKILHRFGTNMCNSEVHSRCLSWTRL